MRVSRRRAIGARVVCFGDSDNSVVDHASHTNYNLRRRASAAPQNSSFNQDNTKESYVANDSAAEKPRGFLFGSFDQSGPSKTAAISTFPQKQRKKRPMKKSAPVINCSSKESSSQMRMQADLSAARKYELHISPQNTRNSKVTPQKFAPPQFAMSTPAVTSPILNSECILDKENLSPVPVIEFQYEEPPPMAQLSESMQRMIQLDDPLTHSPDIINVVQASPISLNRPLSVLRTSHTHGISNKDISLTSHRDIRIREECNEQVKGATRRRMSQAFTVPTKPKYFQYITLDEDDSEQIDENMCPSTSSLTQNARVSDVHDQKDCDCSSRNEIHESNSSLHNESMEVQSENVPVAVRPCNKELCEEQNLDPEENVDIGRLSAASSDGRYVLEQRSRPNSGTGVRRPILDDFQQFDDFSSSPSALRRFMAAQENEEDALVEVTSIPQNLSTVSSSQRSLEDSNPVADLSQKIKGSTPPLLEITQTYNESYESAGTEGEDNSSLYISGVTNLSGVTNVSTMSENQTKRTFSRLSHEGCPYYLAGMQDESSPMEDVLFVCNQRQLLDWAQSFPWKMLTECKKIGEGVYGEVFRALNHTGESVALKIIPVDGIEIINEEKQKTLEEILPEILIAQATSQLREASSNCTPNFVLVNKVSLVQGSYPQCLLDKWDDYSRRKKSENDRPDFLPLDQLFIVFEFGDGGEDLESVKFKNVFEGISVLTQVIWTLAVAENALQFEHRDLHIGNILVKRTPQETIEYTLGGETHFVKTYGVMVFIIDFTMSRLRKDGCTIHTDLSTDESLFTGHGDYQFDVYRMMRDHNKNEWKSFQPKTNVFWTHYVILKLIDHKRYGRRKLEKDKEHGRMLCAMQNHLLQSESCMDILQNCIYSEPILGLCVYNACN